MPSRRSAPHSPARKAFALRMLIGAGLSLCGLAGVAWACADESCQPDWRLASPSYDCAGRAAISPGNDTRINLVLLMRSLSSARAKVQGLARARGDERQLGQTFMSWQGLRASFWPKPATPDTPPDTTGDSTTPTCTPPPDFQTALAAEHDLPVADRAGLSNLRAKVGCGKVSWDVAMSSAKGREYLAYLKAADAFYNGDWAGARSGFAALRHAHSAWVAETASYMPIRIGLRAAVANATGQYGDFDIAKVDAANVADARRAIAAYLTAWPQGRYADSARGLIRRVAWLQGQSSELAHIYEHMLATTSGDNEAAADLAEEIDLRVFGPDTAESAAALDTLAKSGDTPLLLAIADLKRMRHDDGEDGTGRAMALAEADLAAQSAQFNSHADLYDFLRATRAYYAGEEAKAVLSLIPDAARQPLSPLAFSRQTLRGLALARAHDPNEAGFWRDLIAGADTLYQKPLAEMGLAVRWQHDGRLGDIFAANSPITDATTREIVLQTMAPPAILRADARDATRPAHERDIARFTLLYKDLSRGAFRDFGGDAGLVPANGNIDAGLYNLAAQENVPVGLFTQGRWSEGFACPPLAQTAAVLVRTPADQRALLCLGDFWRLNGFDGFALFASARADALGHGADAFPGRPQSRDAIYTAIIADGRAAPALRAYALYRAVMCYAPSGYNGCAFSQGNTPDSDPAKAQRKAWFMELKRAYPDSPWAKSLHYYW